LKTSRVIFFVTVISISLLCTSITSIIPLESPDGVFFQSSISDIDDFDKRLFQLNWTSRESQTSTQIDDGDILIGDLIQLVGTFPNQRYQLDKIANISWSAHHGFLQNRIGDLIIPDEYYSPFWGYIIDPRQFSWEFVDGIEEGDLVNITVDFHSVDGDVMIFWADSDTSTWTYFSNIMATDMVTNSSIESGSFFADRSGEIAIGLFDFSRIESFYNLTVDTQFTDSGFSTGNKIVIDTWLWGRNMTVSLNFTGYSSLGTQYVQYFSRLSFHNFFAPRVHSINVNGDNEVKLISWVYSDRNIDDTHHADVLLSNSRGLFYYSMAHNVTGSELYWNSSAFRNSDTFLIQIRLVDSSGLIGLGFSGFFTAGSDIAEPEPVQFEFTQPDDVSLIEGVSGNSVTWTISFLSGNRVSYFVTLDSDILELGSIIENDDIIIDLDGLAPGIYELALHLDIGSGFRNDTVLVTVTSSQDYYFMETTRTVLAISILVSVIIDIELKRKKN